MRPPAAAREPLDAAAYPTCPGPMDPDEGAAFRAHTVYLVHHGNRESVEVFEPEAMTFERVIDHPVIERFAASTAAVQIGDEIWMGTNRGEKIGYFPAP